MKHKCLAAFIVFLAFISISIALMIFQVKFILRPSFLTTALDKSGVYSKLSEYTNKIQKDENQDLSQLVLIKSYIGAIDPIWAKETINKNVPIIFDYITAKTNSFSINIDLQEYKKRLPNSFLTETKLTIEGLKPCPGDYIFPPDQLPDCLPKGLTTQTINSTISESDFDEIIMEVPDFYKLDSTNKEIQSARIGYQRLNLILIISVISSVIFIFIIILLGISYWPSIPRWVGLALVLPSGVSLALDFFWRIGQEVFLSVFKSNNASFVESFIPFSNTLNQYLLNPSMIISGIIFIIGAILILLSYIIPHPAEPKLVQKNVL